MLFGKIPWDIENLEEDEIHSRIMNEKLTFYEGKNVSDLAKNLLRKMLNVDFSERITYRELFTYELF